MDKKVYEKPVVIEYENLKDITAGDISNEV